MPTTDSLRKALLCALPIALMCAQPPAMAQSSESDLHAGTLAVPLNKSQVVTANRVIDKAMIGNAEIADVLPLTDRSIYVLGKSLGTTSLTLYDKGGRVLSIMEIEVGPDAQALQDQIARLIPDSEIEASISGDSIVLTGLAKDAGEIDRAIQLAGTYAGDNVVNLVAIGSSQQVMLEVKFAEVKRQIGEDFGVRGLASSEDGSFNAAFGPGASARTVVDSDTGLASQVFSVAAATNSFGVFGKTFSALGMGFDTYLNVLEAKGYAKTLAEPTLVALSGETASFLAGGEFPIPVAQSGRGSSSDGTGTGNITIQFKPFGISLAFTPTVLGDHTINLKVVPEVSSIDPAVSVQQNGISVPGLQTRRASTTLELRDGESFAIAGLLQQDFQTTINQIPLLGSIPILGALFRSTEFQQGETELLIVVTPRLVAPIKPEQVVLPTDRIEDPEPIETIITGEPFKPKPANNGSGQQSIPEGDYEY